MSFEHIVVKRGLSADSDVSLHAIVQHFGQVYVSRFTLSSLLKALLTLSSFVKGSQAIYSCQVLWLLKYVVVSRDIGVLMSANKNARL